MSRAYDPERVAKLADIMTKFTSHAQVGDEIYLGIAGDPEMPARYRGSERPKGVITKIKNEGSELATLRVRLDTGKTIDLPSHNIAGDRVWEFTDSAWEKVMSRNVADNSYRGSSTSNEDLSALRSDIASLANKYDREIAEAREFNNALVESIAQITGEVMQTNPDAKFSKVFQQEYKSMSKASKNASPFDSDFEDDD